MPTSSVRRATGAALLVCSLTLGCADARLANVPPVAPPRQHRTPATSTSWPSEGQASYALDGQVFSSSRQRPVPIASVAKVMTAYVAIHRLSPGSRLVVDAGDVADTSRRKGRGESVVELAQGEVLVRHQALIALLLPSANNVAVMLAERVAGSRSDFVALMNQTARELGMDDTTYTDPSGFQPSTTSTARDQLLLFRAAMRLPELASVMGLRSAVLPVAGRVDNTNSLLGQDGFVAGKTGSTSAAGGCLVFRVVRGDKTMDGVVLGQQGGRLVTAGLRAASELSHQVLSG